MHTQLNLGKLNWLRFGKLPQHLLSSTAVVLVMAFAGSDSFAEDQTSDEIVRLRGSTTVVETHDDIELRSSTLPEGVVYEDQSAEQSYQETSFMDDVGNSLAYIRDNFIPAVIFRGSKNAISDRNVSYTIPSRASLRHSMMHSANTYEGLRSSEAGVGNTVAQTLRGSYTARASLARASADRARMHGSLMNFLPKINATVNASLTPDDTDASFSSRVGGVNTGIELSMPLYSSGVNINTYKQAKHLSLASDREYLAEEHRVALEAIAAHVNLRLNRRIERTLVRNVSAVNRIAHIARKLYEAGDASRTDIAIARANVESARAEVDLARKTREETLSDYESLTGQTAPQALSVSNYETLVPLSLEQAIDMAIANNPRLASSMHTAMARKYAARVERGRYGPKVDLYGSYNQDVYSSDDSGSKDWNVGVRLRVPLFDATWVSNVTAARKDAIEAQFRSLDQSRLIERQVRKQWTAYHSAKRRVAIVQRQVNAVATSVEGARREYQAGFRSISDVLNDQLKLARARITLESAKHEKMLAAYELAFTTAHPAIQHLAAAE